MARGLQNNFQIKFGHYPLFQRIGHFGPSEREVEEQAYLAILLHGLEPHLRRLKTHKEWGRTRYEDGGAVDLDVVILFWSITNILVAYVTWKQVVKELRGVIEHLREVGDGRVVIDGPTAAWLAVDSVATRENFADIEVLTTAALRGALDDAFTSDRAFVVGLIVNGEPMQVVVLNDGTVIGQAPGLPAEVVAELDIPRWAADGTPVYAERGEAPPDG